MMSRRGRGARGSDVKIRVERITNNQGQRDNGGVYEDEVVYVTEGPRKRGRPKRPANVVTPVTPRMTTQPKLQQNARSVIRNEVLYITRGGRAQLVVPSHNAVQNPVVHQPPHHLGAFAPQLPRQFAVCPSGIRLVSGITSARKTLTNVPQPVVEAAKVFPESTKINLSNDLQELVVSWDKLPETRTREVVKWLQTPSTKSQQPKIVREIQEMWAAMPETWEEKVDLALEWLQDGEPPKSLPMPLKYVTPLLNSIAPYSRDVTLSSLTLPSNSTVSSSKGVALLSLCRAIPIMQSNKVLVEVQPNPIQDFNQWSSMAEDRENSNN